MKGYEKYLPEKPGDRTLIQAKIDSKLHGNVKSVLDRENLTWHDLLTGLLQKFVDDTKKKPA